MRQWGDGGDERSLRRPAVLQSDGPAQQPFSAVPRMLLERRTPWPARVDAPPQQPPALDGAAAVVTFIGHATFLIQTAAGNILTDPMYSRARRPVRNLLGPRRVRQPAVRVRRPAADLDRPAQPQPLRSLRSADAAPARAALRSDRGHAARERARWCDRPASGGSRSSTGGRMRRRRRCRSTLTPAHHFSARTPFDRNRALWGGFVARRAARRRIYFAGDTRLRAVLPRDPASGSARSIWRCCRSAPTSRAGSCARCT